MKRWSGLIGISWGVMMMCLAHSVYAGDSGRLIFEVGNSFRNDIAISDANGENLKKLGVTGKNPRWFPAGDKFSYFSAVYDRCGRPSGDGVTKVVMLTGEELQEVPYWVADVSNDGTKLLVMKVLTRPCLDTAPQENPAQYELGIYDLEGRSYQSLVGPGDLPRDMGLLSPTFGKFAGNDKVIFKISPKGYEYARYFGEISISSRIVNVRRLPSDEYGMEAYVDNFDVTQDGALLVLLGRFDSDHFKSTKKSEYIVWNLDVNEVSHLPIAKGAGVAGGPKWSKDGKQILFHYQISGLSGPEVALKIVNADGSNLHHVFSIGPVHALWNAFGGVVDAQRSNADWWQP